MGKGGKYLAKKPVAAKKKKKVLPIILIVLLIIVLLCVGAGVLYYNYLLSMITRPEEIVTVPTEAVTVTEEVSAETEEATVGTTSPEETWPEIVSDQNITNILLIGQASRAGEEALIADTIILCSINRETETLTLTSLMRDMCLVWPEYIDYQGKSHTGNNRINMAYNMGYKWANENVKGGMDVLSNIVEYNFGVPVDHCVEVNFDMVEQVMELIGGISVQLTQEEITYLQENYPASNTAKTLEPGECKLSPYLTLCYARMRKVGHGDYERTERQRIVITKVIEKLAKKNILEINKIFQTIMPLITTDMTNKEITNYAFEFIPMLKDLKIQSQRIPFDGNEQSIVRETDGVTDYMIAPGDLKKTAQQLQESIGMTAAEAVN